MSESKEHHHHPHEERLGFVNLLVIVLSIYVLFALAISTFFDLPPEIHRLIDYIDDGICVFFLYEFYMRYKKAKNKLLFMRWGWIDLISSIPTFHALHSGRAVRLIRLLRILRAFRSIRHLSHHVFLDKTKGTFTTLAIIAVLMVIFSSIAILQVEHAPNSNIQSAEDALWWAYVTITTVGYGDKYPVTTEGRIIAVFLMTTGVALFGTFTAYVASWFVKTQQEADEG